MHVSFSYRRATYNLKARVAIIESISQTIEICYPIGIKSEWINIFGKNHSPIFYKDDGTPVLARYKTRTGKDSYFQAFIDTETKQLVESLLISIRPGTYHSYTFQEVISVRRPDKTLVIK